MIVANKSPKFSFTFKRATPSHAIFPLKSLLCELKTLIQSSMPIKAIDEKL